MGEQSRFGSTRIWTYTNARLPLLCVYLKFVNMQRDTNKWSL